VIVKRVTIPVVLIALVCLLIPLGSKTPVSGAPQIIGAKAHETFNPEDGKIFVLVIGNDARVGNPDQSRADAMHIVGINTDTMRGGILNFPRDSYVDVPGRGSMKMNESLYAGGPDLLVQTLEQETGIKLDYWVMTGFVGFRRIVRDLGGVEVNVPYAIDDPLGSGAKLKQGKQMLDPTDALAFTRARKTLPNGDIDRSTNQGTFLLSLLRKFHDEVVGNPSTVLKWMAITRQWTRLDIPADELFRLGVLATQVPPENMKSVTVPVSIGAVGAASVVFIQPEAKALYRRFEKTGTL
jgi:polyisoprenyl-teichoic acid--peptidoglycan teichoic acid transferase